MESFDLQNFKKINAIIERDSKDSTYKFALLRGTIDISQIAYRQHRVNQNCENRVFFPIGLLIDRWLVYYYPFIEKTIPQRRSEPLGENAHGKGKIAFRDSFKIITDYYANNHMGFVEFYQDYQSGKIPDKIAKEFRFLINEMIDTITSQPMRYLGKSQESHEYSIFNYSDLKKVDKNSILSQAYIIENCGLFSYPADLYEIFQYLGILISGESSIINQWADFTVKADKTKKTDKETVITLLTQNYGTERITRDAKKVFLNILDNYHNLKCVWSDKEIVDNSFEVDHMIPFAISKNNELWNLLPAHKDVNRNKKKKIPFEDFLEDRKELIFEYWNKLRNEYPIRFDKEVRFSVTGKKTLTESWHDDIFDEIKKRCHYYIEERGYEGWRWPK